MRERRHDIDGLRVFAMLAVYLFHCSRLFDTEAWHLKNPQQSEFVFLLMRSLVWPWVMELFFLLAGCGTWFALQSRSPKAYLWERFKRLLIPLYTVGLFLLLPAQFYFEQWTHAGYRGRFWGILEEYFRAFDLPCITAWPDTLFPLPFSGHLWFLQYLFLISLVCLPLMFWLRSASGRRWVAWLLRRCEPRARILFFALPPALVLITLRGLFEAQRSWADFLWYAIYFVIGAVLISERRFTQFIKRDGGLCLVVWLLSLSGVGLMVLLLGYDPFPGHEPFSWRYLMYQILWSMASWSAVAWILSMGARHLGESRRLPADWQEAVLPFYLLHQTVILAVGFFVIRWHTGILVKFIAVCSVSFVLIMLVYELLIRRWNAMRLLFGMRLRGEST